MGEKCTQAFRNLLIALCVLCSLSLPLYAESENRLGIRFYGSFLYTDTVPNALFFFSDIKKNDSFELRKALRNHDIDTLILSSRGGSVWEGLSMAGIIHDKGLTTYVPKLGLEGRGDCASACSFMFFAGKTREAEGGVGVHQFYSGSASESAEVEETEEIAQFTVSEIIGFLNEFDTPPFVFERMFQQSKMYYFDNNEMKKIARTVTPLKQEQRSEIEGFINEFLIELAAFEEEEASEAEQKSEPEKSPPPKQQPAKDEPDTYTQIQIVKNIQTELNRLNCNAGAADGVIGNGTKSALARYAIAAGKFIDEGMLNNQGFLTELQTSQVTCNAIIRENLFGNLVCSDIIYGSGPEKITIYNISNPPSQKDQGYKVEICKKENSCKIETYQEPPTYLSSGAYIPDLEGFSIMSGNERYRLGWNYGDENGKVKLQYQIIGDRHPGVEFPNKPAGFQTVLAEARYSKCTFSSKTTNTTTSNEQVSLDEPGTYTQVQIVKNIQIELNRLNCNAGVADGVIGNGTKSALARYAIAAGKFIDEGMLKDQEFLSELQTSQVTCNAIIRENLFGNLVCSSPQIQQTQEIFQNEYSIPFEKVTIFNLSNVYNSNGYKIETCKKNGSCEVGNVNDLWNTTDEFGVFEYVHGQYKNPLFEDLFGESVKYRKFANEGNSFQYDNYHYILERNQLLLVRGSDQKGRRVTVIFKECRVSSNEQVSLDEPDTDTQIQIVKSIQTQLNRLNCNAGLADGVIGNGTKSALARYAIAAGKFIDEGMLNNQGFLTELQTSEIKCDSGKNKLICQGKSARWGHGNLRRPIKKIIVHDISSLPIPASTYKLEICYIDGYCETRDYSTKGGYLAGDEQRVDFWGFSPNEWLSFEFYPNRQSDQLIISWLQKTGNQINWNNSAYGNLDKCILN